MKIPLNKICKFIIQTCKKYNIDDSHGIKHALDVYKYSRFLVKHGKIPESQENIIYTAALLHDTCDNKYMNEIEGINNIRFFLGTSEFYKHSEIDVILNIIQTMSYSKVKEVGFPDLGLYQQAYHVVREADLLTAYDFDRCLLFTMHNYNVDYDEAFKIAKNLYEKRMAKHIKDGLITSNYGIEEAIKLNAENMQNIKSIETMLDL